MCLRMNNFQGTDQNRQTHEEHGKEVKLCQQHL